MRFSSRPTFFAAALLIAAAAHADTGSSATGRRRAQSDPTPGAAVTAPDTHTRLSYADRADPQPAASDPDTSQPARPEAHAAGKATMIMVPPDPADPEVQKIWSAP